MVEIDWVLESFYQFEKGKAVKSLESILKLKGLKFIDRPNPSLALELYRKYNIKFIDALIASYPPIFKKEAILISYDGDFDKMGIIRKEPGEIKIR